MKVYNVLDSMVNKIIEMPFVKENISSIYSEPKFLKEKDKWVAFYYDLKKNVSVKDCLCFEKEVSEMFCNDEICCDISHIDFAPLETKEGGTLWKI